MKVRGSFECVRWCKRRGPNFFLRIVREVGFSSVPTRTGPSQGVICFKTSKHSLTFSCDSLVRFLSSSFSIRSSCLSASSAAAVFSAEACRRPCAGRSGWRMHEQRDGDRLQSSIGLVGLELVELEVALPAE